MSNINEQITSLSGSISNLQTLLPNAVREYVTVTGTTTVKGGMYAVTQTTVIFEKPFIENPTVSITVTDNPRNDFTGLHVSSVNLTNFVISGTGFGSSTTRYATVSWTAGGYVYKDL